MQTRSRHSTIRRDKEKTRLRLGPGFYNAEIIKSKITRAIQNKPIDQMYRTIKTATIKASLHVNYFMEVTMKISDLLDVLVIEVVRI